MTWDALVLRMRFPLYSITDRNYQVRISLILPPPSALIGALARGLAYIRRDEGSSLDELAQKFVSEIMPEDGNNVLVTAKPFNSVVLRVPILLKRLKTLEGGGDSKKKKGSSEVDEKQPKGRKEDVKSDVFIREYMFSRELLAIFIFKDISEEKKEELLKAAFLINVLGDTESVGSVVEALWLPVKKEPCDLSTYVREDSSSEILRGNYLLRPMFIKPFFGQDKEAEKKNRKLFVLPLKEERQRSTGFVYYRESPLGSANACVEFRGVKIGVILPRVTSENEN